MSTGSQADMLSRIKSVLPGGWFPATGQDSATSATPVLDTALSGPAWALAWFWQFLTYVTTQARIATASGINLDMIAADFFGSGLARNASEADTAFRARILAALFPKQGTRQAIIDAASAAAGGRPVVFEPGYALDAGGWDVGMTGYDVAGSAGWGTRLMPFQAFLTARPGSQATVYAAVERARPVGTILWTQA
jgi:hypothetical protein